MNENAKKWVKALRSGEYKQGVGVLHNPKEETYCCLGVGCDLFHKENPSMIPTKSYDDCFLYDGRADILPPVVSKWLGLSDLRGQYSDGLALNQSLINKNDSGCSFEEIADLIESEPEGLFVT